ncbi:putative Serine/threonine-protein kinase [Cercophora samala]|uniref:Serine/threonine-protein kinase n=1 Tax=Cercophora samala TaxID=330535 RepID=A0AA40D7F1_9PEZI|nr:putative Serine/threonine-protein kinase [Cercophora samala]
MKSPPTPTNIPVVKVHDADPPHDGHDTTLLPSLQVHNEEPDCEKDQRTNMNSSSPSDRPEYSSKKPRTRSYGSPIAFRGGLEPSIFTEVDRKDIIDESDAELRGSQEQTPSPRGTSSPDGTNYAAIAPFRGEGGLPVVTIDYLHAAEKEPSEITDLGNRLHYANRKTTRFPNYERKRKRPHPEDDVPLQIRLFRALHPIDDPDKDKGFIPADLLPVLINEESVREELSNRLQESHDEDAIREYARKICTETTIHQGDKAKEHIKSFRKIFAILVLIEKSSAVTKFLKEDISDLDLPLVRSQIGPGEYNLRRSKAKKEILRCFENGWTPLQVRNFEDWQWTTLAPFFAKSRLLKEVNNYQLQDRVVLPFLKDSRKRNHANGGSLQVSQQELWGGGGRVFQAIIHPDHHNFHTGLKCRCVFAIKQLHSQDKDEFKREVDMLKKFSNEAHPHLISLLATYEQRNSYFLVFPWADADLWTYWKDVVPNPTMDQSTIKWVAEQCKGIADGVLKIHKYGSTNSKTKTLTPDAQTFGHHGDIKPENVLFFCDPTDAAPDIPRCFDSQDHHDDGDQNSPPDTTKRQGTLKLTDFGLASTSSHRTVSRKPRSRFGMTYNYRAPECDLPCIQDPKGRQYDMWTLGCLYLEFITWLIGGGRLLDDFTTLRAKSSDPHGATGQSDQLRTCIWYGGSPFPAEITSDTLFTIVEDGSAEGGKRRLGSKAIVKPAVTEFIKWLHTNPKCTEFVHDFLDMIERGLLVVKQENRQNLNRYEALQVLTMLSGMNKKCEKWEYSCKPAPW